LECPGIQSDHPVSTPSYQSQLFFLPSSFIPFVPIKVLKISRHDDWDVSKTCQRIDSVVPLESPCLVPLCKTVDHVIAGGMGTSPFMRNPCGGV
jgi:hypothetical protein